MKIFYSTLVAVLISLGCVKRATSQLVVNNATNSISAVQDFLLGSGVQAFNIVYTGNNDQIASFTCANCNLGLPSGVVMSSGNANTAAGPNNAGGSSTAYNVTSADADLNAISAVNVFDACILQFDFIPTGDSLVFRFVFGSDEYPEYTNNIFNDSFGFFLSGPGIAGPFTNMAQNIAIIPNTTVPISINNLNNGNAGTNGPCEYCQYYIHNGTGAQAPFNSSNTYIQADGFTTVLEAYSPVQCGETYRIKLAIADGGDASFNSWVFLEANSFTSNNLDVGFNQSGIAPSLNTVYEGCEGGSITFTRPPTLIGDAFFNLTYTGSATNGVDYETMPAQIFFPEGVDEVIVPFVGIFDGFTEGQETVTVTVQAPVACASTAVLNLFINEVAPLVVNAPDQVLGCNAEPQVTLAVSGGIGQYEVEWSTGLTGNTIPVPFETASYTYTVSDLCGVNDVTGTVEVTLVQYDPISIDIGADQILNCLDNVLINPNVGGGAGGFSFQWTVNGSFYSASQVLSWFSTEEAEISVTATDLCGVQATETIQVTLPPVAVLVDLGEDITADCLGIVLIESNVSGGVGNYQFEWIVNDEVVGSGTSVEFQPGAGADVILNVTDQCGNISSDQLTVSVVSPPVDVVLPQDLSGTCLDFITVSSAISGGNGGYFYQWEVNGVDAGNADELIVQAEDGLFVTLTVTDLCGGTGVGQTTISSPSVPVLANLGNDPIAACFSDVVFTPTVSGGVGQYSYAWFVNGTAAGGGTSLTVEAIEGVEVSVTVTDECGNAMSDEAIVSILPTPIVINMPATQSVACLSSFTLNPIVTGGTGVLEYEWTIGGSVVGSSATLTQTANGAVTVFFEVVDLCGNVATDNISIVLSPVTVNLSLTPDQAICPGDNAALTVQPSGGVGNYTYSWNTGSSSNQINVSPSDDQDFTVTVTDGCANTANGTISIDVLIPETPLTASGSEELCPNVFSGSLFGGGVTPLSVSFNSDSLEYNGNGGFSGILEGGSLVTVQDFCDNEVQFIVSIKPCSILIPNVFSPNNDDKNQNFEIIGISGFPNSELVVFNRWGAKVFEDSNYENSWSGRDLPEGTYFYVLKRSDGESFSGYVTLLR